jgi:hypothetical protein
MSSDEKHTTMSPGEQRTTIIGVMWFAIALIGIALAIAGGSPLAIFGLVIIALLSTFVLMRDPGQGIFSREKRKRQQPADQGVREGELPADADSLAALLDTDDQYDQVDRDRSASG